MPPIHALHTAGRASAQVFVWTCYVPHVFRLIDFDVGQILVVVVFEEVGGLANVLANFWSEFINNSCYYVNFQEWVIPSISHAIYTKSVMCECISV
jgi:hypothetical protein